MQLSLASRFVLFCALLLFSHEILKAHDLVDLQKFNPAICVNLRFATCDNFLRQADLSLQHPVH